MIDLLDDGTEREIRPEFRSEEQVRPEGDRETPAEGELSSGTRISESEKRILQTVLMALIV